MFAARLIRVGYIEHDETPLVIHRRAVQVMRSPQGFGKHETNDLEELEEQVIVSDTLAGALVEALADAKRWVKHSIGNTAPMVCFYAAIMVVELENARFWYCGGIPQRYNLHTCEVI